MLNNSPFDGLLRLAQNNEARRKMNGAIDIELPEVDTRIEAGKIVFHPVPALRSQMFSRQC